MRDGQVFYIHNRVESIDRAASKLHELVPEARIAVGHGQMSEGALEEIMVGFWEKKYDVLVSTTIVESGLDIPNANTLIVERADTFGLSQLHQIRGRVGRARERGYAYFLYPPEKPLTETAYDRLATIAQHTELGGGMAVAMKDLEIRGSGNLLGGEQAGHIAGVGFDLYVRLVGEAVAEFRGDHAGGAARSRSRSTCPSTPTCRTTTCRASSCDCRPTASLAGATTDEAVDLVRDELLDRFGPLPPEVQNLLAVARFRVRVPPVRRHRGDARRTDHPVLPGGAARVRAAAAQAPLRPLASTSRRCRRCRCSGPRASSSPTGRCRRQRSVASRSATSPC